jgi:hypothetical protein
MVAGCRRISAGSSVIPLFLLEISMFSPAVFCQKPAFYGHFFRAALYSPVTTGGDRRCSIETDHLRSALAS